MQLEGIAIDVTEGKKFFTKGSRKADLVDPTQLVSIEAGLAALQALYGQDVVRTQIEGSHSRLQTAAMGGHRQRGVFRDDLVDGVYRPDDFTKRGLPAEHGMQSRVSPDGQEVMYWRATVSGWVLGLAVTAQGDPFGEYLYGGSQPPAGLPSQGWAGWWGLCALPPDWS